MEVEAWSALAQMSAIKANGWTTAPAQLHGLEHWSQEYELDPLGKWEP